MRVCKICGSAHEARGLCKRCYARISSQGKLDEIGDPYLRVPRPLDETPEEHRAFRNRQRANRHRAQRGASWTPRKRDEWQPPRLPRPPRPPRPPKPPTASAEQRTDEPLIEGDRIAKARKWFVQDYFYLEQIMMAYHYNLTITARMRETK